MRRTELSGSNAYRRIKCAGSRSMERGLTAPEPDDTAEGVELHQLLADPSLPRDHLPEYSAICLRRCEEEAAKAIAYCVAATGDPVIGDFVEVEQSIRFGPGAFTINHIDRLVRGQHWSLVIDYKTGRIPVDPIEDNWQIGCYIVSESLGLPKEEGYAFFGQIIQPRVSRESPMVRYSLKDATDAFGELCIAENESRNPDAVRTPGDHCAHCLGYRLAVCPDVRQSALTLPILVSPTTPQEFWASIDPAQRTKLMVATKHAQDLAKILRDSVRELMTKDPEFVPGFATGGAGIGRTIEDPEKVAERLLAYGFPPTQIKSLFRINVGDVEALITLHHGLKGDELDAAVEKLLEGCVDTFERKRRIVKAKPGKKKKLKA